jgi:hypothetical protein
MRDPFLKEPLVVSWVDFELRTLHIEVIFLLANEAELELAICANTKVFDFIKLGRCSTVREWAPREVIHYFNCLANGKGAEFGYNILGQPCVLEVSFRQKCFAP